MTCTQSQLEPLQLLQTGVVVFDANLRVTFWNRWMIDHSGISAQSASGRTMRELFPAEDLSRLHFCMEQAIANGQSATLSHSIHPKLLPLFTELPVAADSERLKQSIVIRPLLAGEAGRNCLIQITDVTPACHREKVLREQADALKDLAQRHRLREAQARAIIENIHDALVTIDGEDRIVDLNQAARSLFVLQGDATDNPADALFQDFSQHRKSLGENGAGHELTGLRSNGAPFPAEVGVSKIHTDAVDHRVLIVRDLTERKQAEENLFREKEFAQITLQSIHEAVITTDAQGRINSANSAACGLLRKVEEDVIDRPLLDLLTFAELDQRRAARQGLKDALGDGRSCEMIGVPELKFEDGETIYVNGRISALRGAGGGIIGSVVAVQDITLEKRMKEILSYQATHDELTSLINRREFERLLDELLHNRIEPSSDILLYLDLDQFKLINDSCGHDAGDQLLKQLTGLLRTRLRHTDTLARLGGDEFAALLPNCDLDVGKRIAEELREIVREYRFNWGGRNFAVGVSIGLVSISNSMDNNASVLAAADSACYIAKENGRDQVMVYQPDGNEVQKRRDEMSQAARIRESLERDRLALFAQPIVPVEMHSDSRWGVEILVRMFDDDGRMVPPMAFIPAAERYNLMSHIDRWVVDALCAHWVSNESLFERIDKVAINLSGQSVANDEFLDYVVKQIEAHQLPWNKLCFEITETAAVASIEKAQRFMGRLSAKGCRFALDDFGSGLSSFTYLKHLPVDYLKIDGAFVKDMLSDEIDAAMVRSISDIGRSMGLKTIAEFVEDENVLHALHEAQVHFAQGYGICKPMPLEDIDLFTPKITGGPVVRRVQ